MMVVSYDAFGAVPSRHPLNAGLLSDFYVGTAALEALGEADLVAGFGVIDGSETERLILEHAGEADAIQRRQAFGAGARAASRLLADKLYRSREIPIEPWYQRRYFDEGRKPWSTSHDRARTVACISGAPS